MLSPEAGSLLNTIEDIQELLADAGRGYAGRVRVAANEPSASLRLPFILADFCRERPQVQLSLDIGGTKFVAEKVEEGDADFGLCSPPASQANLIYEPLFEEHFELLMSSQNPLADRSDLTLSDLSTQRMLMKERTCHYRTMIEWFMMKQGSHAFSGIEVGSFEALKRMVQANLGISFVPKVSVTELPPGTVSRTLIGTNLSLSIGLIYRADTNMSKAAESLLGLLRIRLGVSE